MNSKSPVESIFRCFSLTNSEQKKYCFLLHKHPSHKHTLIFLQGIGYKLHWQFLQGKKWSQILSPNRALELNNLLVVRLKSRWDVVNCVLCLDNWHWYGIENWIRILNTLNLKTKLHWPATMIPTKLESHLIVGNMAMRLEERVCVHCLKPKNDHLADVAGEHCRRGSNFRLIPFAFYEFHWQEFSRVWWLLFGIGCSHSALSIWKFQAKGFEPPPDFPQLTPCNSDVGLQG